MSQKARTVESVAASIDWMKGPLISALVNCLTVEELADGFKRIHESPYVVRRALMRALSRDTRKLKAMQVYIATLLDQFEHVDYKEVRALAWVLREIAILDIPQDNRRWILTTLLNSRFANVRASGYKAARQTLNDPGFHPEIERVWRKFHDPECASLVVDRMPLEFLLAEFNELDTALLGFLSRARLYIRAAQENPSLLERLQKDDEVAWTYVKVKLNHPPLTTEEALALFWRNELHAQLALLLWCFGQMGL